MQLDALFKQTKLLCEGCKSDDIEQARHAWNLLNVFIIQLSDQHFKITLPLDYSYFFSI